MANEVSTAFVQQFYDQVIMLAQQKGSRLRGTVMEKPLTGNAAYFERLGPTEVLLKTSRHSPTPSVEPIHSRRMVVQNSYNWNMLLDPQDSIRMLIDPRAPYAANAAMSFGRKIDDIIISAATGTSVSVSSSMPDADNRTNVSFDDNNRVDADFGTADSNLTVAKLIEARRILSSHDVDEDEDFTIVLNSSAIAALLNTTQVTSSDFNTVQALVQGKIDTFMGLKFIRTERIGGVINSDPNARKVLVYCKSAIGLAVGQDIKIRMSERSDLSYAMQVYGEMDLGATRIEEEKVVQIDCYQTA